MSTHHTKTHWSRKTPGFDYDTYGRDHVVAFAGGSEIGVSAAADFKGNAAMANPEELLVGALSSCHMLTFLAICAKKKLTVDSYDDEAEGFLEKNAQGRLAVTRVVLKPRVAFAEGTSVDAETLTKLHESAHRGCFIASSVQTDVRVEPR